MIMHAGKPHTHSSHPLLAIESHRFQKVSDDSILLETDTARTWDKGSLVDQD